MARRATLKDKEQLTELHKAFFRWECTRDSRLKPSYGRHYASSAARDLKNDKMRIFVAERDGKLVGYAKARIEKNPAFIKEKRRGHLMSLFVGEAHHNKGRCKALMHACLDWFDKNNIKDRVIFCYAWNKKPLSIYRKKGYKDYLIELTK